MGQWVAVAYDNKYYIGKVTVIKKLVLDDQDEILIILPEAKMENTNGTRKKDTDVVSAKYMFCTNLMYILMKQSLP